MTIAHLPVRDLEHLSMDQLLSRACHEPLQENRAALLDEVRRRCVVREEEIVNLRSSVRLAAEAWERAARRLHGGAA